MSDLIKGFKSCVMTEVLHHEKQNGTGVLRDFTQQVNTHRDRYLKKSGDPVFAQEVNRLADSAIARAQEFGISVDVFGGPQ